MEQKPNTFNLYIFYLFYWGSKLFFSGIYQTIA